MRNSFGRLLGNIGLMFGTLLVLFALLEFVVFRFILVPSDVLRNVSINSVVRYEPNARATFRHPDASITKVAINADGWNSTWSSYRKERTPGVERIAVVGDSYVHGAFINTEQGFPEVLQSTLNAAGRKAEVYRFGMDGAPLSQYLWMLRQDVLAYKPDVVIIPLIHNDFDESYRLIGTRYNSSFMKIRAEPTGAVTEVPPVDFRGGWTETLRESNTFRYLYYSTNAYLTLKSLVTKYVWGKEQDYAPEFISSAVDIRNLDDDAKLRWATRYILSEMKKLAAAHGFKLLVSMDGVREAIYDGKPPASYRVGVLNMIAREETSALDIPFLDLQDVFAADWVVNKQRFEYSYDWHWNARANELVGKALAERVKTL